MENYANDIIRVIIFFKIGGKTMFRKIKKTNSKDNLEKEEVGNKGEVAKELIQNINMLKNIFNNDDTLIIRQFRNQTQKHIKCCILFIDGMVNSKIINENIIDPIIKNTLLGMESKDTVFEELEQEVIVANRITKVSDIFKLGQAIVNGNTVLLLDGHNEGLIISTEGWQHRALSEPTSEKVVRGPREGFTESLMINLTLIRRKIKTSDLKFQFKEIGERSKTKISVIYLENLVNDKILEEVIRRLDDIKIDGILDSGYIEELIKDSPTSPFLTVGNTERPDVVAGKLLEGRIAIVVDGSPFVLTVPFVFLEYFQANEDYYNNYIWGSINRLLRIVGGFITVSVPAMYIALVTFHQEMIPTQLLLSITSARKDVPFPTIIESIGLLFVFELLRETGVRMPTAIGQTVSIVGALVLGQAAVEAKFVSAPMVIIVAVTGITGLVNPKLSGAFIVVRLIFMFLASVVGMYGYIFGFMGLLILLMGMRSFGIPYMLDIGMLSPQDLKDTAIRAPWWYMEYRPKLIAAKNYLREKASNPRRGE